MKMVKKGVRGFTLIEMLVVVGVMAVVGTMVVTQFGGSEQEAAAVASTHNADALEETVNAFDGLYNTWPYKWHTGLSGATSVEGLGLQVALNMALDAADAIPPAAIADNFSSGYQVLTPGVNVQALTADEVRALRDHGLHQLTNEGYTPVGDPASTATTVDVDTSLSAFVLRNNADLFRGGTAIFNNTTFVTDFTPGTEVVTINGRALSTWNWPGEAVVLLACTKDVNWKAVLKGDPDRTGFGEFVGNSQIEIVEPPLDPNAKKLAEFPYYWGVFYLSPSNIGGPGYSGDLLGILDSELNPVRG